MLRFKQFMVEYLTDEQRNRYKDIEMTPKARADTDHHFGKGNDLITDTLDDDAGHNNNKSEIHRAVENHIGKEISHDEYRSGITRDQYGRPAKLGRMIKDEKLRNQFASDNSREGSKKTGGFTTSTVRGTEVAGQTNSEPNKEHPKGHSWGDLSCKNVDNGANNHYLPHEIQHGTVVHRVHDHNGQEIYRATLQPHHNEHGDVAYSVNSEYGIMHPAFRKSAEETAKKLSGPYKPGLYKIHPKVYDDSRFQEGNIEKDGKATSVMLHPTASKEHIDKALNDLSSDIRLAAAKHPNATSEHINKALDDSVNTVRRAALHNPNITSEHIDKALKDSDKSVRSAAVKNKKATSEHIDKALNDPNWHVRFAAAENPNATKEHLNKVLKDKNEYVRVKAVTHKNTTTDHIEKGLSDNYPMVRSSAVRNHNATKEQLDKAMKDPHYAVRSAAVSNPNATKEHIDKALDDESIDVRSSAASNHNATKEHLDKAIEDKNGRVRWSVASNPNATKEHLDKAIKDEDWIVRKNVVSSANATREHIEAGLKDSNEKVQKAAREALEKNPDKKLNKKDEIDEGLDNGDALAGINAMRHPKVTLAHITKALDHPSPHVRLQAIRHPKANINHIQKALKDKHEWVKDEAKRLLQSK